MNFDFGQINWIAVFVCFVVGQVYLTLWFTVFFGDAWAQAYQPGKTKAEHTKEVPGFTYAIGAACTLLMVIGLALLQTLAGVQGVIGGISVGLFVGICFVGATMIPGYAFLRRWPALILAAGSQISIVIIISLILSLWT